MAVLADVPVPDKLRKLLGVLPSENREAFYEALMSHWQQPEQAVVGGVTVPTMMNSPSCWPRTD
ncbi:hypothetical protein R0J91_20300, partial [Micrococcus sp. SIMBA_131]